MHVVSLTTVLDMLKMFSSLLNVDVDECTAFPNICDANTDCHNTDGSYTCICKAGYTGDGKSCFGKGLFYLKLIVFTISEKFLRHGLVYIYHQTQINLCKLLTFDIYM